MSLLRTLILSSTFAALGACSTLHSNYERPNAGMASTWRYAPQGQNTTAAETDGAWWSVFSDATLNRFVETVLASNNDLAAAALNARQARLQAELNAAQLGPRVSAGISASQSSTGNSATSYNANASLSYELDLWGALAAARNASDWEARASVYDRDAVELALAGSSVTLYWQLALINLQIEAGEQSLTYAEQTQRLVRAQYDASAVSGLEVAEAEQTVQSQRSSLTQLTQTRVETRNAIALLLDGAPWPEANEPRVLPLAIPTIDAGLPSDVLARRPDLRAAEARLRATLASGDASRLSYYPSISLTTSGGASSTSLTSLLRDPVGTLAANLALPFLQANDMALNSRITEAQFEATALNFRQTLQTALVEVENALSARSTLAAQGGQLSASLRAAETAEQLYETRYRAGAVSLRDWLDAQERRRQATLTLQANRASQLANQVALSLALGGSTSAAAGNPT